MWIFTCKSTTVTCQLLCHCAAGRQGDSRPFKALHPQSHLSPAAQGCQNEAGWLPDRHRHRDQQSGSLLVQWPYSQVLPWPSVQSAPQLESWGAVKLRRGVRRADRPRVYPDHQQRPDIIRPASGHQLVPDDRDTTLHKGADRTGAAPGVCEDGRGGKSEQLDV